MLRRVSLLLTIAVAITWPSPARAQSAPAGRTVATFDGTGANAWAGNVRISDDQLVAVFEDGVRRSPTLRGLAERLTKSDVIVYVRPDVMAKANTPSRMTFLSSKGGVRYLVIRVPVGQSKDQQIAMLGHEMQHAVSIADAPSVVDSPSLRKEFERIGNVTQSPIGDDFSFESALAADAKRKIYSEVTSQPGKAAQKVASADR